MVNKKLKKDSDERLEKVSQIFCKKIKKILYYGKVILYNRIHICCDAHFGAE